MIKMIVSKGSSINADTVEITITDGSIQLFQQKYWYGYNASHSREWATDKKPFIEDIILRLSKEYKVSAQEEVEGRNLFREYINQMME